MHQCELFWTGERPCGSWSTRGKSHPQFFSWLSKVCRVRPFHSYWYRFNSLVTHIDNYTNWPPRAPVGWAYFCHSTNPQFLSGEFHPALLTGSYLPPSTYKHTLRGSKPRKKTRYGPYGKLINLMFALTEGTRQEFWGVEFVEQHNDGDK